jgi:hypothetical protein
MLHSSDTGRLEAEIKLLKELEARYHKAIQANEAFVLLKKLYLEIKQSRERLYFIHAGIPA